MAAGSGDALALAARLRALDDGALAQLIRDRGVRQAGVRDYFDLAEALLDRGSVHTALSRLDRPTLAAIAVAGELAERMGPSTPAQLLAVLIESGAPETETAPLTMESVAARLERAVAAGLVGGEFGRYAPWLAVSETLRSWPQTGLPGPAELVSAPPPPALQPVSEADAQAADRGAAEQAFATLDAVGELLIALRESPARRLSRGGLALPDARRLAAAARVAADEIEPLLAVATRAQLAALDAHGWQAADGAEGWLALPRADRWAVLAQRWHERMSPDTRAVLVHHARTVWGEGLLGYLRWLWPAGGAWLDELVISVVREGAALGIVVDQTPSSPGAALLTAGPEAARDELARLLPPEVDRVYVQHDLSIIAPGPLTPAADALLRGLAEAEARGMAPSFRVTAGSLTRALVDGATAASIRDDLASVSLTGIPQPLEYLISDTAARFGTLRVGALPHPRPGARSYLRSGDQGVLGQLLVDPNLTPIALAPDPSDPRRLVSRFAPDVVFWTLHDARYPVVAEDEAGAPLRLPRQPLAGGDHTVSDDTAAIVVTRLRTAGIDVAPGGDDWVQRQLQLAIKNRSAVSVTVKLPDGSQSTYLLEPAAVAAGRLRARDRRSDIERTLPLSSIVAVEPA